MSGNDAASKYLNLGIAGHLELQIMKGQRNHLILNQSPGCRKFKRAKFYYLAGFVRQVPKDRGSIFNVFL